jgi:hypothetical protein
MLQAEVKKALHEQETTTQGTRSRTHCNRHEIDHAAIRHSLHSSTFRWQLRLGFGQKKRDILVRDLRDDEVHGCCLCSSWLSKGKGKSKSYRSKEVGKFGSSLARTITGENSESEDEMRREWLNLPH